MIHFAFDLIAFVVVLLLGIPLLLALGALALSRWFWFALGVFTLCAGVATFQNSRTVAYGLFVATFVFWLPTMLSSETD